MRGRRTGRGASHDGCGAGPPAQADALDGGPDGDSCDGGIDPDTAVDCETTTGVP